MVRFNAAVLMLCALAVAGCGSSGASSGDKGPTPSTSINPAPGRFTASVDVTITSNIAATIHLSTDGVDPHTSPTARALPSPAKITLTKQTTLMYFARTDAGAESEVQTAQYDRVHYAEGAVVVGESIVGNTVSVALMDAAGAGTPLASQDINIDEAGEFPFEFDDLDLGDYRVIAYVQGQMQMPQMLQFSITEEKPWATGLNLYLDAAKPDTGTLNGTVTFGKAVPNQGLAVIAVPSAALTSGDLGNIDPSKLGLWAALTTTELRYPYTITNIEPGSYIPICALGDPNGGIDLTSGTFNMLLNPLAMKNIQKNGTVTVDFNYGSSTLQGNVTVVVSKALPTGTTPNVVVAARAGALTGMWQLVRMASTVALVDGSTTEYKGTFSAVALGDSKPFEVKVFATADGSDPTGTIMPWLINPMSKGDKTVTTNGGQSTVDLTVNVTVP